MTTFLVPAEPMTSRNDPEDGPEAKRVSDYLSDTATRAIIGFACEAGVRRNKGRLGAKQAPAAIRQALASLAAPAGFQAFSDLGDVVVEDDALEACLLYTSPSPRDRG